MSVLFNKASGLIALSGGAVSHLALAAREYGLPMLVGVHTLRGADYESRRMEIDAAEARARFTEET
jgi:phosphoenolpyruvate-protein kinase (PTS system EI component)